MANVIGPDLDPFLTEFETGSAEPEPASPEDELSNQFSALLNHRLAAYWEGHEPASASEQGPRAFEVSREDHIRWMGDMRTHRLRQSGIVQVTFSVIEETDERGWRLLEPRTVQNTGYIDLLDIDVDADGTPWLPTKPKLLSARQANWEVRSRDRKRRALEQLRERDTGTLTDQEALRRDAVVHGILPLDTPGLAAPMYVDVFQPQFLSTEEARKLVAQKEIDVLILRAIAANKPPSEQ